jgi:hypothetical protein
MSGLPLSVFFSSFPQGALLVFDLTKRASFEKVSRSPLSLPDDSALDGDLLVNLDGKVS